jgi:hypothetical protein
VNKIVDPTILKELKANNMLLCFHEDPHFTLDVTSLTPDEAAEQIYEYIMDIETRDYVVGKSMEDKDVEEDEYTIHRKPEFSAPSRQVDGY